jgi:hypothetical protein
MITTTFEIGIHTVTVHDPADTPEKKAKQMERIQQACIRFMTAVERERSYVRS